jgi:hypothetical protein
MQDQNNPQSHFGVSGPFLVRLASLLASRCSGDAPEKRTDQTAKCKSDQHAPCPAGERGPIDPRSSPSRNGI